MTGNHSEILLGTLPPIVHICAESDKTELCWSVERVRQEVRDQRPGALLVEQQLAYMMLVQALWLHLADGGN